MKVAKILVVAPLLLSLAMPAQVFAASSDIKAEIDSLKEQQKERGKEIRELERSRRETKALMDKIDNGTFSDDPDFNGDCDLACKPGASGGGWCSEDLLKGLGLIAVSEKREGQVSGDLVPNTGGKSMCMAIWERLRGNISGLPSTCSEAVLHCGEVHQLKMKKRLTGDLATIQGDIDAKKNEIKDLGVELRNLKKECAGGCNGGSGGARELGWADYLIGGIQALTPTILGGMSLYAYDKGLNSYATNYGNYVNNFCVPVGVPCGAPMGMGIGMGGMGGMMGGMGGIAMGGMGGIAIGGMGGIAMGGMGGIAIGGMGGIAIGGMGGIAIGGMGGIPMGGMGGIMMGGMGGIVIGGMGGMMMGGMGGMYPPSAYFTGGYGVPMYPYGTGFTSPMFPYGPYGGGGMGGIAMGGMGGIAIGGMGGIAMGGMGGIAIGGMGGIAMGGMGGMGYPPMYGGAPGLGYGNFMPNGGGYNPQYASMFGASNAFSQLQATSAMQSSNDMMIAQQQLLQAQQRMYQTSMGGGLGYGGARPF